MMNENKIISFRLVTFILVICCDENIPHQIWFRKLRFIDKGKNSLPEFISCTEEGYLGPIWYDTLKIDLIKIDSFIKNGIISGGIFRIIGLKEVNIL